MVSVRTSGQLVLDELLRVADRAAGSLAGAVRRRMDEAAQAKVLPWRKLQPSVCPTHLGGGYHGRRDARCYWAARNAHNLYFPLVDNLCITCLSFPAPLKTGMIGMLETRFKTTPARCAGRW